MELASASVAVIIVNYNSASDALRSLLDAYLSSTELATLTFFVVDNASADSDRDMLRNLCVNTAFSNAEITYHHGMLDDFSVGGINVVFLPTNHGFSYANNIVLSLASSCSQFTHYLLLNSDCFVFPDTINNLVFFSSSSTFPALAPRIGAIGGTLLYEHNPSIVQAAAGGRIHPFIFSSRHYCYKRRLNYAHLPSIQFPDFITGAMLLLTREAIISTGLFDESFFLYQEDKDYCLRLKKAGFQLTHSPTALALHKEGGSMTSNSFSLYYTTRNLFYIIDKHATSFRHLRVLIYLAFALSNAFLKPKPFFTQKVIIRAFQAYCLRLSGSSFLPTNI